MAKGRQQRMIPLPDVRANKAGSWGHATGRVWCLEKDLLGRSGLDRLYAAESADEVRRLLLEHRYPQKDTVDSMVQEESVRLFSLLDEVTPDDGYHQIFLLPYDAHNLKTSLKAALITEWSDEEQFLSSLLSPSLIEGECLWRAVVRGEKDTVLPAWAQAVITRAREAYLVSHDASSIDRSVDRDIHYLIAEIAKGLKDAWLAGYFDRVRDLTNMETLLRSRLRSLEPAAYADSLLAGGIVEQQAWHSFLDFEDQAIIDDLCGTPYEPLSGHYADYGDAGGASRFALDRDKFLCGYLEQGSRTLSGPPRVIAYLMARACEFKNIRMVMSALTSGLGREAVVPLRRDF